VAVGEAALADALDDEDEANDSDDENGSDDEEANDSDGEDEAGDAAVCEGEFKGGPVGAWRSCWSARAISLDHCK